MITNQDIINHYRHKAEEYAECFDRKPTKTELELYRGLAQVMIRLTVPSLRFLTKRGFEKDVI